MRAESGVNLVEAGAGDMRDRCSIGFASKQETQWGWRHCLMEVELEADEAALNCMIATMGW